MSISVTNLVLCIYVSIYLSVLVSSLLLWQNTDQKHLGKEMIYSVYTPKSQSFVIGSRGKFLGMPMRDFYRSLHTLNMAVPLCGQASRTLHKGKWQLRISMNLPVLLTWGYNVTLHHSSSSMSLLCHDGLHPLTLNQINPSFLKLSWQSLYHNN